MKNARYYLLLFVFLTSFCKANDYFVSPYGEDTNPGTRILPFATVGKAVSVMKPGDTCYLREGRYHEAVVLSDLHGTADSPLLLGYALSFAVNFHRSRQPDLFRRP